MEERGRRVTGRSGRLEDRKTHRGRVSTLPHLRVAQGSEAGCPCKSLSQGHHGSVILPTPCPMLLLSCWVLALPTGVGGANGCQGRLTGGSGSVCSRCTCGRGTIA